MSKMQQLSRYHIVRIYIYIHNHQNLILDFFAAMCKKRPPSFFKATFTSRQVSSALLLEQSPLVPMATRWEAEAHPSIGMKQGNGEDVISLFRPKKGKPWDMKWGCKISFIFCG